MTYPRVQSVGVVVFDGSKVLLVRHGKTASHFEGVCGLPSGKIDPGEKAIETAVRELYEETGLIAKVSDMHQLPNAYQATITQKDGTKIFDWYVFVCKKYEGELRGTSETEPFWVEVENINTIELLPNVEDAIHVAKNLL